MTHGEVVDHHPSTSPSLAPARATSAWHDHRALSTLPPIVQHLEPAVDMLAVSHPHAPTPSPPPPTSTSSIRAMDVPMLQFSILLPSDSPASSSSSSSSSLTTLAAGRDAMQVHAASIVSATVVAPCDQSLLSSYVSHHSQLTSMRDVFDFGEAVRFQLSDTIAGALGVSSVGVQEMSMVAPTSYGSVRMSRERFDDGCHLTDAHILIWLGRMRDPSVSTVEEDLLQHYLLLPHISPLHPSSELTGLFNNPLAPNFGIHSMARLGGLSHNAIAIRLHLPMTRYKFDHKLSLYTLANYEVFSTRDLVSEQATQSLNIMPGAASGLGSHEYGLTRHIPCMFLFSSYQACRLRVCAFSHSAHVLEQLRAMRRMIVHTARMSDAYARESGRIPIIIRRHLMAACADESMSSPTRVDLVKYQLLLNDCVITPPSSAVLAVFAVPTEREEGVSVKLSAVHYIPEFVLPPFKTMNRKLEQAMFDRYFTVCRRRRIAWMGAPLGSTPSDPNLSRVADANNIWRCLVELLGPTPSHAALESAQQLVFVNRSTSAQTVVMHFKSEAAARTLVSEVCAINAHMNGRFEVMGIPARVYVPQLPRLELAYVPIASVERANLAAQQTVVLHVVPGASSQLSLPVCMSGGVDRSHAMYDTSDLYDTHSTTVHVGARQSSVPSDASSKRRRSPSVSSSRSTSPDAERRH